MGDGKNRIFKLEGKVQYYDWGGNSYLPELLNRPNPEKKPFAEYWMGAHNKASSILFLGEGRSISLNEFIHANSKEALGSSVSRKFGRLPFLLKILDVKDMLSIQVHPNKKDAEREFKIENKKDIPLHSPVRNYKDDNHKPELMVALSEFWLLHGFKPRQELINILEKTPELRILGQTFDKSGYKGLYKMVMTMDQHGVESMLQPLISRIIPAYEKGELQKSDENFWAARAALTFNKAGSIDRGIFSIYFFNLVHLRPFEGIFQDAGLPHAYLEGQNIEIMANSDNVLRAGLTPKHVDVPELMKQVAFRETIPNIVHGKAKTSKIKVFSTPTPDFELSLITLNKEDLLNLSPSTMEIFFLLRGSVIVKENPQHQFMRNRGEAFVVMNNARFDLKSTADTLICKAGVGVGN
ncbi:MAG: mannose-6-phosphate isomerase, class I [Chitinophagales bacterium]